MQQVVDDLQKYDTLQVRFEQLNAEWLLSVKHNADLRQVIQKYGNQLQECSTTLDDCNLAYDKLKLKNKKQRRWLRLLSLISITSILYTTTQ